jgi:2-keto-3-deoxy-L-rhamnonate aldolase RhmA
MRVLTADLGAQSRREAADPLKAAPDPGRNGVIAPNVRSQAQAGRVELPVTTRYSHGVRRTNSWRARWSRT